jgi:hypothetical protein
MTTFTINSDMEVTAHRVRPKAIGEDAVAFTSLEELRAATKSWDGTALIRVWNGFAGVVPFDDLKPVKKFETRGKATERIWSAIQRLIDGHHAEPETEAEVTKEPAAQELPKPEKKAARKKAAAKTASDGPKKKSKQDIASDLIRRKAARPSPTSWKRQNAAIRPLRTISAGPARTSP